MGLATVVTAQEEAMITLYARREPTIDPLILKTDPMTTKTDVVLYEDEDLTKVKTRILWYSSNCPRRGKKTIKLNGYIWTLKWKWR